MSFVLAIRARNDVSSGDGDFWSRKIFFEYTWYFHGIFYRNVNLN